MRPTGAPATGDGCTGLFQGMELEEWNLSPLMLTGGNPDVELLSDFSARDEGIHFTPALSVFTRCLLGGSSSVMTRGAPDQCERWRVNQITAHSPRSFDLQDAVNKNDDARGRDQNRPGPLLG